MGAGIGRLADQLTRALARPIGGIVESVAAPCHVRRKVSLGERADGSAITEWQTVAVAFPINVTTLAVGYAERRYGAGAKVVAEGMAPLNATWAALRQGDGLEVAAGEFAGQRLVVHTVDASGLVIQRLSLREAKPGETFAGNAP